MEGICIKSAENPFNGGVGLVRDQSCLVDAFEEKLSLLLRWSSHRAAQSKQLTSAVARRCWRAWRGATGSAGVAGVAGTAGAVRGGAFSWRSLKLGPLNPAVNRVPRYTMTRILPYFPENMRLFLYSKA